MYFSSMRISDDMVRWSTLSEYPLDVLIAMKEYILKGDPDSDAICPICKIMTVHYDLSKRDRNRIAPWCEECLQYRLCREYLDMKKSDEDSSIQFAISELDNAIKYRKKNYKD